MTTSAPRLTPEEIAGLAQSLPRWRVVDDGAAIRRELKFADFRQAFAFMTAVASAADAADHHPEWSNTYNRVSIRLATHDAGGLTGRDVHLAEAVEREAARFGERPALGG